jgi:hypothetical protein
MDIDCKDVTLSSLIMHTDPNLPAGWKRKVVKRSKGSRYDVYIISPAGKRFRSNAQVQDFLTKNTQLGLTMDQFSFSLTKDKQGPKHGLTKLIKNTCLSENVLTKHVEEKVNPSLSEPQETSSCTLARVLTPLNIIILPPAPTTQLLITYIQPQPNFVIQVFDHPTVDINEGDMQGHEVSQDIICDNDYAGDTHADNDLNGKNNINIKNFIRRTALQTLLPQSGEGNVDHSDDKETKETKLTELEELDLYYDFNYASDNDEEETCPIRSVFDDDSDEEM